jgi:spore germination cell wall hydrolase CwlJ-like protein
MLTQLYKKWISLLCLLLTMNVSAVVPKKPVQKVNEKELTAAILVAEAAGEGTKGMKAVMEVIRTRMKERHLSMYRVVTERNAFSCFNKYRNQPLSFIRINKRHPSFVKALWIVNNYFGKELTKGSNYYHEKTVHPSWSAGEKPRVIIGRHLFFALIN